MSWSRRKLIRATLVTAALTGTSGLLAACGFKPLYGQASTTSSGATVDAHLAAVRVKSPVWERSPSPFADAGRAKFDARVSQVLHNALRDGFNPYGQPQAPAYELGIELSEQIIETLTADSGDAEREDLTLNAHFTLLDAAGNELLLEDQQARLAYAVLQEPYQDLIARNDARERAARLLADLIKLRISAYFARSG